MSGVLYHSPAEIIAQLMIDLGLANGNEEDEALTGWVVFPLHLPETPDQAIQVQDTAGRLHNRTQVTGETGEHYGIQVLARSPQDPVTAYRKIKQLLEYFDTEICREEVTVYDEAASTNRTYMVHALTRTSVAIPSGNDGRRYFYAGNALASIELQAEEDTGTGS